MGITSACYLAAICATVISITPAHAGDLDTGNTLQSACSENNGNPYAQGMCLGFVAGVAVGAHDIGYITTGKHLYCFPPAVTLGQMVKVVQLYMANHPEKLADTGVDIVLQSLTAAFPCPVKK